VLPTIRGRAAWIFAQPDFDIDNIVGVENIKLRDIEEMKKVCMAGYDPDFAKLVMAGDVLLGGENFGYGHPHYVAFKALRALGIKAVFAESFNPGFYRGEVSNGWPLIEVPGILETAKRWDTIVLDWDREEVTVSGSGVLKCSVIPRRTREIVACGGLVQYIRDKRV